MSIKVRQFRTGGYEVDIHTISPDGASIRERVKSPVGSKEATKRWALLREAHLALAHGPKGCCCKARPSEEDENDTTTMTVERFLNAWIEQRKAEHVAQAEKDEVRLRDHVIPVLGQLTLVDVRPRHAYQLVKKLERTPSRRGGVLAPRTIRGIFFTARQGFQHAVMEELIPGNPMVLPRGVLPRVQDKDPSWRATAIFTGDEVERLISDPRVSPHRRVAYALEFFTGCRTGEVSALRWGDYDAAMMPLGKLTAALSYDSKHKIVKATKTVAVHEVPVHPTLAKVLAKWKLTGWRKRHAREPRPQDLIIPTINGTHRDVRKALEDFHEDLGRLGLRKRRHYDARRTFISLGLDGGASKDILQSITHPRPADAFDLYRTPAWAARCEAILKLKIELREGKLIQLPVARIASATGELAETNAMTN